MEKFLITALEKILPVNSSPIIIPHEGKQDLEKSIPKKLRAWRNNNDIQYRFIIIRDKDSGDCIEIKNNLRRICREAGREEAIIIIAIHELESWFLGDLNAVEKAYNINGLSGKQRKKPFREPDRIANPSQLLEKICKDGTKVSRADRIVKEMDFESNNSQSFNYFLRKIKVLF